MRSAGAACGVDRERGEDMRYDLDELMIQCIILLSKDKQ